MPLHPAPHRQTGGDRSRSPGSFADTDTDADAAAATAFCGPVAGNRQVQQMTAEAVAGVAAFYDTQAVTLHGDRTLFLLTAPVDTAHPRRRSAARRPGTAGADRSGCFRAGGIATGPGWGLPDPVAVVRSRAVWELPGSGYRPRFASDPAESEAQSPEPGGR